MILMRFVRICSEVSCARATLDILEMEHVAVRFQYNFCFCTDLVLFIVLCRL